MSGSAKTEHRAEALEYGKELADHCGWRFRAGLLVSFMAEHQGHDCVFFSEHDNCEEEINDYYEKDTDYWQT